MDLLENADRTFNADMRQMSLNQAVSTPALLWSPGEVEGELPQAANTSGDAAAAAAAATPVLQPVQTIPDLYEAAAVAAEVFQELMNDLVEKTNLDPSMLHLAPLKGQDRAAEKARDDYSGRTPGPAVSWLFDIVRGSLECDTEDQICSVLESLFVNPDPRLQVIRLKNRFINPTPGGFRDVNMNIRIRIDGDNGAAGTTSIPVYHVCELQVHHQAVKGLAKELAAHDVYSFFRTYFRGSLSAVDARLRLMEQILGNEPVAQQQHAETSTTETTTATASTTVIDLSRQVDDVIRGGEVERLHAMRSLLELMNEADLAIRVQQRLLQLAQDDVVANVEGADVFLTQLTNNLGTLQYKAGLRDEALVSFRECLAKYEAMDVAEWEKRRRSRRSRRRRRAGSRVGAVSDVVGPVGGGEGPPGDHAEQQQIQSHAIDAEASQHQAQPCPASASALAAEQEEVEEERAVVVDDSDLTLDVVNNIAIILMEQCHYSEAKDMFMRALRGNERLYGTEHLKSLVAVNNLAIMNRQLGNYEIAKELYERALAGRMAALGKDHPDTVMVVGNLSVLLNNMGQLDECEVLTLQALESNERLYGPDHPETLGAMANLTNVYISMGRRDEARVFCEKALRGREVTLGPDHLSTLSSVLSLSAILMDEGDIDEALRLNQRVAAGHKSIFGSTVNLSTLVVLNNQGVMWLKKNELQNALQAFEEVRAGRELLLGPLHSDTLYVIDNCARMNKGLLNWDAALRDFQTVVEGRRLLFERDGNTRDLSLSWGARRSRANVLKSKGESDLAHDDLYALILDISENGEVYRDWNMTFGAIADMAYLCLEARRLTEAKSYFENAVSLATQLTGPENPITLQMQAGLQACTEPEITLAIDDFPDFVQHPLHTAHRLCKSAVDAGGYGCDQCGRSGFESRFWCRGEVDGECCNVDVCLPCISQYLSEEEPSSDD